MAYNLEEQEQLENLKAFWKQYGNFILTVITVAALAVAGWRGWGWYQAREAAQASAVYEQLREAASAGDIAKVRAVAGTLFEQYGSTAYGEMAALVAARAYVDAGDPKAARVTLEWAVSNAKDDEFRHAARLRLAALLIDEKAYDEAGKLLAVDAPGKFAGEYADRRGDLLTAQGKPDEARAAYRKALEALGPDSPMRRLVQLKLDALGKEAG
ncbi:MAG: tetratricopeptide repeat protein [Burkholderiaceae bacterium]|nr:tetratricopeptide repeat protein [Burkholderiaceae bacterium]